MPFGYQALRSVTTLTSSSRLAPWRKRSDDSNSSTASSATLSNSIVVNLRIEGADRTIFEGPISTTGHEVTIPTAATRRGNALAILRSGKTNKKSKSYYPSPTGALDDAAHLEGFDFDGKYSEKWDDIFITRIADTESDSSRFWGTLLNYQYTKVGGCQQRIEADDHILWAFDAFNMKYFLKLTGPTTTTVGVPITVTVTDGMTHTPISGATLGGCKTDVNGHATVVFRSPGSHSLKAERATDSIRSNTLRVTVLR